jgi:hypothetical protein
MTTIMTQQKHQQYGAMRNINYNDAITTKQQQQQRQQEEHNNDSNNKNRM